MLMPPPLMAPMEGIKDLDMNGGAISGCCHGALTPKIVIFAIRNVMRNERVVGMKGTVFGG